MIQLGPLIQAWALRHYFMLSIFISGILATSIALAGSPDPGSLDRGPLSPYETSEHWLLADSALVQTLRLISPQQNFLSTPFGFMLARDAEVWDGDSFQELCERFAGNDNGTDRFQVARETVLQQLLEITSENLDRLWAERKSAQLDASQLTLEGVPNNVVSMYLAHHIMAIRFAGLSAQKGVDGRAEFIAMLVYEAVAQGYLHDALSSSHMLVPRHDFLPWIHTLNSKSAHTNYAPEGAYVINGLGTAYQAFGDGTLTYYGPNFGAVMDATRASLSTVLYTYLVKSTSQSVPTELHDEIKQHLGQQDPADAVDAWLTSQNGQAYYASANVPGLLHIPTPVTAMWSVKENSGRTYFQQLAEQGYHDPDLPDYLKKHLHSREHMPDSQVFAHLGSDDDVRSKIDTVKTLASVEFVQNLRIHPSFHGLVFEAAGGAARAGDEWNPSASVSFGYGFETFLITKNVSVVGRATFVANDGPTLVMVSAAGNIPSTPLRIEFGPATTTQDFVGHFGLGLGASWDIVTRDLGFTYAGAILRLRYDVKLFNGVIHGPSAQVILH